MVFGIGAAANGGFAFSTLSKLGAGQVRMVATLLGFCLGAAGHTALTADDWLPRAAPYLAGNTPWDLVLLVALLLWAAWETVRLGRAQPALGTWRERVSADRYRLSTAAALMGLSNAVLYAPHGVWPYTKVLGDGARNLVSADVAIGSAHWALFAALGVGVIASTWHGRQFTFDWRPRLRWSGNLAGGLLMGFGAAMIPGGNDVLQLNAIPNLATHAIPAYLGVIGAIAVSLYLVRAVGGPLDTVDCSGDLCPR